MSGRAPPPLESFGPQLLAALARGSRETLTLDFPSYSAAVHFTIRINLLRKRMQLDKHELYPVVARARISYDWGSRAGYAPLSDKVERMRRDRRPDGNPPTKVTIRPQDEQFNEVLTRAGVTESELSYDPLRESPEPPTTSERKPWDDPLKDM